MSFSGYPGFSPQHILEHSERVVSVLHLSALAPQLETCHQLLASKEQVEVAVLGRFKVGKSSLLNRLAGIDVLPVGVVPVTSVITKFAFGEQPRVVIHYLNGTSSTVSLCEVSEFVSEAQNPENRKGVALVVITVPELTRYKGLTFVDTPGTGSIFLHNTAISMNWLARVGAALMAVSVDSPLMEQDLQLLRELRSFTPKIVLLLTKVDLLSQAELDEVSLFIGAKLREHLGFTPPLLPFSIKGNHSALREALDRQVLLPLSEHAATHAAQILHYKLASLLQQLTGYLEIARKSAETSQRERQALLQQILGEKDEMQFLKRDIQQVRERLRAGTRPRIMARLLELEPTVHQALARELAANLQQWNLNLWELTRRYEAWLYESLAAVLASLSRSEERFFTAILEEARRAFARIVESFQRRLSERVERVLGIQLSKPAYATVIEPPPSPQVFIGNVFTHHLDLLWFLIPMVVFGGLVKQHLQKKLPGALERGLARLATQWADTLNHEIGRMADESQSVVTAEIATLEALLLRPLSEISDINDLLATTQELQDSLLHQQSLGI
jgi:GTP-binding protein EngB required for normal cell division